MGCDEALFKRSTPGVIPTRHMDDPTGGVCLYESIRDTSEPGAVALRDEGKVDESMTDGKDDGHLAERKPVAGDLVAEKDFGASGDVECITPFGDTDELEPGGGGLIVAPSTDRKLKSPLFVAESAELKHASEVKRSIHEPEALADSEGRKFLAGEKAIRRKKVILELDSRHR
uniref:Hypoglycemic polypeptide-P n=1 Tax=Momordica charantia TaxID=3673 RepID=E2JCD2_MOMCH|nr:hypoglycemic polypeptide-P [Momordica charantia]